MPRTTKTTPDQPTIAARIALRVDGVVDFTAEVTAREIDWSAYASLRYLRLTAAALTEIARLNRAWWRGEDGGRQADLREADLRWANLREADLRWANLRWANLREADLRWADLRGANLRGADLRGADLRWADLRWADLREADLPSPTVLLLATWGALSATLTTELMRYDAASHPDPAAFDRWAAGGDCPYSDVRVERAAIFTENRALWSPGPCPRPYDLMVAVLAEKCPDWTEEQRAAFEAGFAARRDVAEKASKETP